MSFHLKTVFGLAILALLIGCSEDDDDNGQPNNQQNSEPDAYFEGTIDGQKQRINKGENSYISYMNTSLDRAGGSQDSSLAVYGISFESSKKKKAFGIRIGEFRWVPEEGSVTKPSKEYFHNFFQVKRYDYQYRKVIDSQTWRDIKDGVMINWTDANGRYWTTKNGSTDSTAQNGSNFKITKIIEKGEKEFSGNPYVFCQMQFSCQLYDSAGNSVTLKNGEAQMKFIAN